MTDTGPHLVVPKSLGTTQQPPPPPASHLSRNLLLSMTATVLALVVGAILAREPLQDIYLRSQITEVGLVVNGSILALFVAGMMHLVAMLLEYRREEQALGVLRANLRSGTDALTDGVLRDSLIHRRYDQLVVMSRQNATIDQSALAAALVSSESTRTSFPRFVNNILILTGVLGTIVSLSIALLGASDLLKTTDDMSGMGLVIHGMSTALSTTMTAILSYLVFGYFFLRFTDVQTGVISAVEETTTLYLMPRFNTSSEGLISELAELTLALRGVADQMQQAQRDQVAVEQRMDEIAGFLRQAQKDQTQQQQRLHEAIERHEGRMWRISRDLAASKRLLKDGFRLPLEDEEQQ